MSQRRRSVQLSHQRALPGIDPTAPLTSFQQASGVVGEFFELCTARMVDGVRQSCDSDAGDNPDVVSSTGRVYESKAAGRDRWLLEEEQTNTMAANADARYVLWNYTTPPPGGLVQFETARGLRAWLSRNITGCYVMPGSYPQKILCCTPHEKPRSSDKGGAHWGSNYWFRTRYLLEVLRGDRSIDASFTVRRSLIDLGAIHEVAVGPTEVTWMLDQDSDEITPHDQMLAEIALREMENNRLEVAYIPTNCGQRKKRVAVSENPAWYRAFLDRRRIFRRRGERVYPKKKPRSSGRRQHVLNALRRIVDNDPRPQGNWIGWELLELLREHTHQR